MSMAGHARKGNESRWITKICEPSNLTYSEFHHISSRLYHRKKAANPCLLLHENDIDHEKKGKLPEWSNGPHSKCGDRVTGPGVRIPHFPQKAEGRQDLRLKKRNSAEFLFAYASMRLEFTQKLERGGCKKNCSMELSLFFGLRPFLLRLDFCKNARGSVRDGRSQSLTFF